MILLLALIVASFGWNFIAIGSFQSERTAAAMIRSMDGKNWTYNRVLRAEFPPRGSGNTAKRVVVKHVHSIGGVSGRWLFAGNSENSSATPFIYGPTVFFSDDDGDTLNPAGGVAFGPSFPTSLAFGRVGPGLGSPMWLAIGRTNSSQNSTGFMMSSPDGSFWSTHSTNLVLDQDFCTDRSIDFVNGKWLLAYGLGMFESLDGITWRLLPGIPKLNNGTDPFKYPYLGNPTRFAVSPFGEEWAVGGVTLNGSNVPEFACNEKQAHIICKELMMFFFFFF